MIHYPDLKQINSSFEPQLTDAVIKVTRSGRYLNGKEIKSFEEEFAAYCGADYGIGTANGMDALTLILMAYKELAFFEEADRIIVPANTFISTILSIIKAGLTPVLCEPSPETFNINVDRIEALITPQTKAILPVHLYGQCAEMNRISKIAKKYGLKVIEDAAHAPGVSYQGKRAGNLGDAAAFSFHPANNLGALGDGGAVTTNDKRLAECIRALANYGTPGNDVYLYKGINSHLNDIQAAVLSVKLKRLDKDNSRRRKIAKMYLEGIDHPFITLPRIQEMNSHVFHIFPVFCQRRDVLKVWMHNNNIETHIHYAIPPHRQEALKEFKNLFLPVTEQIHREELSLPISPVMTDEEVKRVIDVVNRFE